MGMFATSSLGLIPVQQLFRMIGYDFWNWFGVVLVVCAAFRWPNFADRLFRPLEALGARIARHKIATFFIIVAVVVIGRACLLPWFPIREPGVADEFSYLLAADTFVHGRLTNPAHPMAVYLDTLQVIQHPTVQSMYPPAQGAVLAIGRLLGHPWIGVLLSAGLMFGLLFWALHAWLPARWALLGTLIPLFRFGIFSYWTNSFYGGAAAAIGGCLVVGSLPRIIKHQRIHDSLLFGIGAIVLANSRPFEGAVVFVVAASFLLIWVFRSSVRLSVVVRNVLLPVCVMLILGGTFIAYYNYRVTGNALLLPHSADDRLHLPGSNFVWTSEKPPIHFVNHEFDVEFNHFSRNYYRHTWQDFVRITKQKAIWFQEFYLGPELCVLCIVVPWLLLSRKSRPLLIFAFASAVTSILVVWYTPHYTAPAFAAVAALTVQSIRYLRRWTFRGRPVGIGLTRAIACMCLFTLVSTGITAMREPSDGLPLGWAWFALTDRAADEAKLQALPGKHLVIVRYSQTEHNPAKEWVHNAADVDGSKVVWAREIPAIDMQPLLNYYHDRQVWLVQPDVAPKTVVRYSSPFARGVNSAGLQLPTLDPEIRH